MRSIAPGGVFVEALSPGGLAEAAGLKVGQRVFSCNGVVVHSHAGLCEILRQAVGSVVLEVGESGATNPT